MIFELATPAIRGDQLADEIYQAVGLELDPTVDILYRPLLEVEIIPVASDPAGEIQAVVDTHVPDQEYFTEDLEAQQADAARAAMYEYSRGLHGLTPHDRAYTIFGRAFAVNDGLTLPEVLAIDSKSAAQSYVSAKPEFQALAAAERAWVVDELNAIALVLQVLLAQ